MNPLTAKWAARGSSEWLAHYWASYSAPHRGAIERAMERVAPFKTLMEIGANCGPNIRRLSERWPEADYLAVDANPAAVWHGVAKVAEGGFAAKNVTFWQADDFGLQLLSRVGGDGPEVILSCYALAYADPEMLWRVINVAAAGKRLRALVLAEPLGTGELVSPTGLGAIDEWHHDYLSLIAETWPGATVSTDVIDPPADRLTTVLTVEVPQ